MQRKLRMGMVGGSRGSFIGNVHRMAAALDGQFELVCGAFSSDPARAIERGAEWFIRRERVYASYAEMFDAERKLEARERMDFVSIVTPNHLHFPIASAAFEAGFHVVCDKPLAHNVKEATALVKQAERRDLLCCVTYNYTGYPMIRQARALARGGKLGKLRKIIVEYAQGWLATRIEAAGQKQALWRTDPSQSGAAGCIGDIGSHAQNLAEYVTGLRITELCADLTTFVHGRKLDDDGNILLRFNEGARGVLLSSQVAVGEENRLALRIYGERGALEWQQQEPNTLVVNWVDQPGQILRTGADHGFAQPAKDATRLPAGHPEGFVEAFANIYREFGLALDARLHGKKKLRGGHDFPTAHDGLRGMKFIEAAVRSAATGRKWISLR